LLNKQKWNNSNNRCTLNLHPSYFVVTSMGLAHTNEFKSTKILDKEFTDKKRCCNNQKD